MTQELDIIENNKLIAEFMQVSNHPLYHLSYDALIPVVEKIEQTNISNISGQEFEVIIYSKFTVICNHEGTELFSSSGDVESRLTNTYNIIVDFIKWYNQQKS